MGVKMSLKLKFWSRGKPEQYLSMWLSEQIPTKEWLRILKERTDVNELYQKHLEKRNV